MFDVIFMKYIFTQLSHAERAYLDNSSFRMATDSYSNTKQPCYSIILVIPNTCKVKNI